MLPDRPISEASLVHPDGARLTMRWSPEAPYLGLWFDNGKFARGPVIAIEPSTGYYDRLTTAIELGRVSVLEPGSPLTWWVEVRAEP